MQKHTGAYTGSCPPSARLGHGRSHALTLRGKRECAQDLRIASHLAVIRSECGCHLQQPALCAVAHQLNTPICTQRRSLNGLMLMLWGEC